MTLNISSKFKNKKQRVTNRLAIPGDEPRNRRKKFCLDEILARIEFSDTRV